MVWNHNWNVLHSRSIVWLLHGRMGKQLWWIEVKISAKKIGRTCISTILVGSGFKKLQWYDCNIYHLVWHLHRIKISTSNKNKRSYYTHTKKYFVYSNIEIVFYLNFSMFVHSIYFFRSFVFLLLLIFYFFFIACIISNGYFSLSIQRFSNAVILTPFWFIFCCCCHFSIFACLWSRNMLPFSIYLSRHIQIVNKQLSSETWNGRGQ